MDLDRDQDRHQNLIDWPFGHAPMPHSSRKCHQNLFIPFSDTHSERCENNLLGGGNKENNLVFQTRLK